MIDIDLRPVSLRYRMVGVYRARTLARSLRGCTPVVLSALVALTYVQSVNICIERQVQAYQEKLRLMSAQTDQASRSRRHERIKRVAQSEARERARKFAKFLWALDAASSDGVSISELRAQGEDITLRGEAESVSALHSWGSELVKRNNESVFMIESLRDDHAEGRERYSYFTARVSLTAPARG